VKAEPSLPPAVPDRITSHRDLRAWQSAMDLVVRAYSIASALPMDERFALGLQIRRAAVSVAANIAEGHGRLHLGDFLRFLSIANGSLMELETLVLASHRLGLVDVNAVNAVLAEASKTGRLLAGLARSLRRRREAGTLPRTPDPRPRSS
jgi:four helix bundle protein